MWAHWVLATVGLLGWCFCGYAIFLFAWTLWKHARPKHAQMWMRLVAKWSRLKDKGWANSLALPYLFALVCTVLLITAAYRNRANVVTEHNVAVYGQLDNGDWLMSSDEQPSLIFRPCPEDISSGIDVNGMFRQAIGYVAHQATWQERGVCKSLQRPEWEFQWKNKDHLNYRKVN